MALLSVRHAQVVDTDADQITIRLTANMTGGWVEPRERKCDSNAHGCLR
jgi:hypothetical protein